MKKNILLCIIPAILCYVNILAAVQESWRELKSTHFIVYYKNAPEDFIDNLIDKAEDYYSRIADDLGFRRYNFWLWENRAKIYVYDDTKSYQAATGQPEWSSGSANVRDKIINTFPYAEGFFDTILPHEMGHIVFREFVGYDNTSIPLWLDEGVASYEENLRHPAAAMVIKEALSNKSLIDLEALSQMDVRDMRDNASVALFYAEAVSVVDYLVREFGRDDFVNFCQRLRDKKNLNEALFSAYSFRNLKELSQAWEKHLGGE